MTFEIPKVGCGLRLEVYQDIINHFDTFQIVEIMADHYLAAGHRTKKLFTDLAKEIPVILHGVGLSIGSAHTPDIKYLKNIADTINTLRPIAYTEHLAFTNACGIETAHLLPLPRTVANAELLINNINFVKHYLDVPFYLENIAYYFDYSASIIPEPEFLNLICSKTKINLLLDIENLRLNAINHHYDPYEFITAITPNLVKCIHVAGGTQYKDLVVDTHDQKLCPDLFNILRFTLQHHDPESIILERDGRLNQFEEVLADCKKITALTQEKLGVVS